MISRFISFVKEHQLFNPGDRILLAVSGGIDSMVMWHLFESAGMNYSVTHCNFKLRGEESDRDEELVRKVAAGKKRGLFVNRFETLDYAKAKGISVEMAARELRYAWFESLRASEKFAAVATAHHQDDLIETFFINLVRKTGIKGLTGFREKSGTLVRPMLFTNRKEIEGWAREHGIPFRQDSTNNEIVFQRNFIRHNVIPGLEKLNPAFRSNLYASMKNLREVEDFYQSETDRQLKKICTAPGNPQEIYISSLMKQSHPKLLLYEWMSRYGFNAAAADALFSNLEGDPGRQYFSKSHRLVTGRNALIITELPAEAERYYYIGEGDTDISEPVRLSLEKHKGTGFEILRDHRIACIDAGKLAFPLVIRTWKQGEYFQPLGMTGFKKISDFFVDEKLSLPEKEASWILYSGDKVVWIIGQRLDNRFRITAHTRDVLVIRILRSYDTAPKGVS